MDTPLTQQQASPPERMAALLLAWRNAEENDDTQLRRWLSRRDLPYAHYQIDWACDAIIAGIEAAPAKERPPLRTALAKSLARILNLEPERATEPEWKPDRDGGRALTNLYALATALDRPQELAEAVARAFLRGVPPIEGEHAPVGRRLFDAAMMTQIDNRLATCWTAFCGNGRNPDPPLPDAVRDTDWGIMWWDIWAAIVRMPGPRNDSGRPSGPSRHAIAQALPWLTRKIEAYKPTNAERLARLEFELGRIDKAWPIKWRPFLAPVWLFLELPTWVAPLYFSDVTAEWKPNAEIVRLLKHLRTAVQHANWDDHRLNSAKREMWMDRYTPPTSSTHFCDIKGEMTSEDATKYISSFWCTHIEYELISQFDYKIDSFVLLRTTSEREVVAAA